jgi:hypothetical protein
MDTFCYSAPFGIKVKDVHIYVNTLICQRVGSAQNVFLVISGHLVINVFILVLVWYQIYCVQVKSF